MYLINTLARFSFLSLFILCFQLRSYAQFIKSVAHTQKEGIYVSLMLGQGEREGISQTEKSYLSDINLSFTLLSTTPAANSSGIAPNTDLIFDFDSPISGTALSTSIRIRGEQTGLINGVFSGGGTKTITFNPDRDFKPGEVIFVDILKDLSATDATTLGKSIHFEFRTRPKASPENPSNFFARTVTTNTNGAKMVYAADMDNDGDLDLLTASNNDNKIAIQLNNGNKTFTERVVSSTAFAAQAVYAADMDNDGDLDLLAAAFNANKILLYQNDGSLNFTEKVINTTVDGPGSVFAADVDGDGDLDAISISYRNGSKVFWHENRNGTFFDHPLSPAPNGTRFIRAADVDQDGDVDLLTASFNDDKIAWYENDGNQNFTLQTISTLADFAQALYPIDLDQDGDMDVLSASQNDNEIAWYENDGSRNFTQRIINSQASAARSVYAADVDGDGDLDVLSASLNDDKIAWYENDGSQNFTPRVISTLADGAEFVYAADVDGDGDLDVLSASDNDDKIVWYENLKAPFSLLSVTPAANASGVNPAANLVFNFETPIAGTNLSNNIRIRGEQTGLINGIFSGAGTSTITFDPNQDFKAGEVIYVDVLKDLSAVGGDIIAKSQHFEFRIATQPSPEDPTVFLEHTVATGIPGVEMVYPADMDEDGDMDVLAITSDQNKISLYLNDGNEVFTEKLVKGNLSGALALYPADLDNDGDLDIVAAVFGLNLVAWYQNDGNLNFTERVLNNTVEGPGSVFAVDIDGDGDLDVVSASYLNASRVFLYENQGSGIFLTRQLTPTPNGTRFIRAADLDKDGDVDLLTASFNDDQLAWYENDGSQNFILRTISTLADFAQALYAIDLDKDGDMDLLSASQFDNEIAWYQNNGSQSFTQRIITNQALAARSVYAADVNGDGFLDVLSASLNDDKIAWYQNDGNQNFTARTISTLADGAEYVQVADMDNDGDLDVLSASDLSGKVFWYENYDVDNPPIVINPISHITVAEDAAPISIDLTNVFGDSDSEVAAIVKRVASNSNTGLVSATINGNTLTLTFAPNAFGTSLVSIEANSNGLTVTNTFQVQVNPVDDSPSILNPIPDLIVDINASDRFISLSNVFGDIDNDPTMILPVVQGVAVPTLLKADTVDRRTLKISVLPNQLGVSQVIIAGISGTGIVRDTFMVTVRLNPPINLRANPASIRAIELIWQHESTQTGIVYEIQRSFNKDFNPIDLTFTSPSKTIEDSMGVISNTTYYYRIRAVKDGIPSAFSNITASQASNVPKAPSNLTLTAVGSKITLNWKDNANNETGHRIERASLLTLNNFIEIQSLGANVTTFQDSARQANLTYVYRVRAFNTFGNSSYSDPAQITLAVDNSIPAPIPPISLSAESISTRQIDLRWEYNLDTTTIFIIERAEGVIFGDVFDTISVFRNDQLTRQKEFSDFSELVSGQFYAYRVVAINGGGVAYSNIATARAICNLDAVIAVIRNDGGSEGDVICEGKKASLVVIPYLQEARYQWRRNGLPITGANFATYLAGETGLYDCEVSVDTCVATSLKALQVVVNGQPREVEISFDGVVFRALPEDATNYQWFVDFDLIPGANQNTFKPQKSGFYYVLATFGVGVGACKVSSNIVAYPLITAQESFDISKQIQVFPNPYEESFVFSTEFGALGDFELQILDLKGNLYGSRTGIKTGQNLQENIQTPQLSAGVYLLRFRLGSYWGNYKIVKF